MATSAESVTVLDEINARYDEEDQPGGLTSRLIDSCLALQRIADENDIDADLICVE